MIESRNLTSPFPLKSLVVDIENAFLLERAIASVIDVNTTEDSVAVLNFTEFRAILNQGGDSIDFFGRKTARSVAPKVAQNNIYIYPTISCHDCVSMSAR